MKNILGYVQHAPCRIDLDFKDENGKPYKKTATVKSKGSESEELVVYTNKDTIQGEVKVIQTQAKKFEHAGIKVQLVGQIELAKERGQFHDFVSLDRNLAAPGELSISATFPFEFRNVELMYDSYRGQHVRCRYFLRVLVLGKGMVPDTKKETPFWVRNYEVAPEASDVPIKMEVGIEECLHIEFEYDKAQYHLKDMVIGKIYFLLVRIKLKHMELEIRRRESTGTGASAHSESETLAKYEIMDGAPVRGESIPIRLYLTPYELSPSYKDVHNKFSVRYFLNLVLVDEEDRRYFKQQEITLFRQEDVSRGVGSTTARLASNANASSMDVAVAAATAGGSHSRAYSHKVSSPPGVPLGHRPRGSFDEEVATEEGDALLSRDGLKDGEELGSAGGAKDGGGGSSGLPL